MQYVEQMGMGSLSESGSRRKNFFGAIKWDSPNTSTFGSHDNPLSSWGNTTRSSPKSNTPDFSKADLLPQGILSPSKASSQSVVTLKSYSESSSGLNSYVEEFKFMDISACAYLGDELSSHGSYHGVPREIMNGQNSYGNFTRNKAASLDALNAVATPPLTPMLMKMPSNPTRRHFDKFLEAIPGRAWMVPYIIACSPPTDLSKLLQGNEVKFNQVLNTNSSQTLFQMNSFSPQTLPGSDGHYLNMSNSLSNNNTNNSNSNNNIKNNLQGTLSSSLSRQKSIPSLPTIIEDKHNSSQDPSLLQARGGAGIAGPDGGFGFGAQWEKEQPRELYGLHTSNVPTPKISSEPIPLQIRTDIGPSPSFATATTQNDSYFLGSLTHSPQEDGATSSDISQELHRMNLQSPNRPGVIKANNVYQHQQQPPLQPFQQQILALQAQTQRGSIVHQRQSYPNYHVNGGDNAVNQAVNHVLASASNLSANNSVNLFPTESSHLNQPQRISSNAPYNNSSNNINNSNSSNNNNITSSMNHSSSSVGKNSNSNPSMGGLLRSELSRQSSAPLSSLRPIPGTTNPSNSCWRSLGTHMVSSEPTWVRWEPRLLVVLDNYLFECSTDATNIIGFAQLNRAEVTHVLIRKTNRDQNGNGNSHGSIQKYTITPSPVTYTGGIYPISSGSSVHVGSGSSSGSSHSGGSFGDTSSYHQPSNGLNIVTDMSGASQMLAIQIEYLSESDERASRKKVWICCNSFQEVNNLHEELDRLSKLTLEQVYDFQCPNGESGILSNGRFTDVRMAKRKNPTSGASGYNSLSSSGHGNGLQRSSSGLFPLSPEHAVTSPDFGAASRVLNQFGQSSGGVTGGTAVPSSSRFHKNLSPENQEYATSLHACSLPTQTGIQTTTQSPIPIQTDTRTTHSTRCRSLDTGCVSSSPTNALSSPSRGFHVAPDFHNRGNLTAGYLFGAPPADQKYCALKTIDRKAFVQRVKDRQERADSIVREVLCQLLVCRIGKAQGMLSECLPVVDIYGAFETLDGFSIELELMQPVDLCDKLQQLGKVSEVETRSIMIQILNALILCRTAGVGHRDVKLSNITIARPPSLLDGLPQKHASDAPMKVKLADFGMAGFVGFDGYLRGRCGTIGYVAPEILCAGVQEGYLNNVDLFSLGVVAYTLLCGHEPFYGRNSEEFKEANKLARYDFNDRSWRDVSGTAIDWIRKALDPDPCRRMTPSDALQHPWLFEDSEHFI